MKKIFTLCVVILTTLQMNATKYYLYAGANNPWGTREDGTVVQVPDGTIHTVLNSYSASDEIWIATGTYATTSSPASIAPKADMAIYGGFYGNETTLNERQTQDETGGNGVVEPWEFKYPTVITGAPSSASATYNMFSSSTTYTLDGLTIQNHTVTTRYGGGIYNSGASACPVFNKCTFRNINKSHDPTVNNTGGGSAIYLAGNGTITSCLIENNTINITASGANSGYGGTIYASKAVTVTGCVIRNNNVAGNTTYPCVGGAICLAGGTDAITAQITNNVMYNNQAKAGSAIYINGSTSAANIINNTFVNNLVVVPSGSINSTWSCISGIAANTKFYNNVVYNNQAVVLTAPTVYTVRNISSAITVDMQNCAYNGGATTNSAGVFTGTNNNNALSIPAFVAPSTTIGYTASMPADVKAANFAITATSQLIKTGLTFSGISPDKDIVGNSRSTTEGGKVDIGAYEIPYFYKSNNSGNWSNPATWQYSTDGTNWAVPASSPLSTSYNSVTILQDHTITVDANSFATDITVNVGGKLTINSGSSLAARSITLTNNASGSATLIDNNTLGGLALSTGAIVNQNLSSSNSSRNWYISSPVYNAKSSVFTPASTPDVNSNCLYWYNETSGASGTWTPIVDNTTSLIAGTGYIAHLPSASYGNYSFTGSSLNSGSINVSLTNSAVNTNFKGFNLVGNPYPSYLKWNDVSAANTGVSTTMYYKTMAGTTYFVDTYNANGSQSVSASGNTITGYIPPMQAFWVYAPAATTLSLTNAMRSHADVAGNKLKAPQQAQGTSLRLRVTGGDNTDEVLLYTNAAASNNFDSYDSPKMSNANVAIPEIYCIVDGQKTVINGLNTIPFNQALPLGFSTGKSGNFTLKVAQLSNPDNDVQVWINDKTTGTNLLLSEGTAFSFSSDVVEASDRFSVIFKSASASTGVNTVGRETVNVYTNDQQQIVVNVAADSRVDVYNVAGNRVYSQLISNRENTISHSFNAGIYLVKVGTGESASIHRVIIK